MPDLSTALSDEELERLEQFLFDRIDEDADTADKDEGVLDIAELDGFFTAIASGPVTVPPSQWLPAVWGDFEPVWEDERDFQDIFSLMMRHMNVIAAMLMEAPEEFEPLFNEREVDGRFYTIVDEWCEGYWRGARLTLDEWKEGGKQMATLLTPILAFTGETDWRAHACTADEIEVVQQAIAPNVQAIHAYWLARRAEPEPASGRAESVSAGRPVRHAGPRVGRNDPCPCGSGKKYKKCCLQ
jgi:uncharacterized protein